MKIATTLFLIGSSLNPVFSQRATFKFETEMCEHIAVYEKSKYTEEQLRNTLNHLVNSEYLPAESKIRKPGEEYKLDRSAVLKESNDRLKVLKSLKYVKDPFWEQARKNRIRETEELTALKLVTMASYKNPDTLLTYKNTDSLANYYREALIEGDERLLSAWLTLNEEQKKKNGYPQDLQRRFDKMYNSSEQLEYARIEVTMYGWWNSCNHLLFRSQETIDYYSEYRKLFVSLKDDCEEMD